MQKFREYFSIFNEKIYLDYASVSPFSKLHKISFLEAYHFQEKFEENLIEKINFLKEDLKNLICKFIGAESKENIALIPNTSFGISTLASGLNLKNGDRIAISSIEFPANVYPFLYLKTKGVEVDFIKPNKGILSIREIKKSIKKNTKLLSLSFVQFLIRNIFYSEIKKLKIKTITLKENPSGIVTIETKEPEELFKFLKENNVIISKRVKYLRFSFHFINKEEDVLNVIELLKKYKKTGRSADW